MDYQQRTIAYLCELHHPPLAPDPRPIQKLHNEMYEGGDPPWSSFAVTPAGPVLSNPVSQPGAVSLAAFLADRIQFREEMGSLTYEDFAGRIRSIAEKVSERRGIQMFTGQTVTIRCLINPRTFRDSRAFLRQGMFRFAEEPEVLGRDPQLYGLRLVFPPGTNSPDAFALRIESYNRDPRSLFLENQGTFGPLITGRGLVQIEENVRATYAFLRERAIPFVARFDARQEA